MPPRTRAQPTIRRPSLVFGVLILGFLMISVNVPLVAGRFHMTLKNGIVKEWWLPEATSMPNLFSGNNIKRGMI